ncbi:MAG: radical SAM protein [Verrucomicrobiota bacterium]
MKRVLLISPLAPTSLMGGKDFFFRLPNLGMLRVASLTPSDWELKMVDEKVEPLQLDQLEADIVGITAMTPTVKRAYEIAAHFRARGIKVIMGGMHVTQLPEEAMAHCDSVIVGEAELLWPQALRDFEQGALKPLYRHENGLPSLLHLPPLDRELFRKKNYLPVHFVETTRGCPLDCEFCAVTTSFGGAYRTRTLDEVMDEVRALRWFEGGPLTLKNLILFVDDNIVANRTYARELFTRLADLKWRWFAQTSMNIAKDTELLRLCQRSGCMGFFMGFETLSQDTLNAIGKKVNHPEFYREAVQKIHDHGIGIDASFVFGFDTDELSVMDRTLEFVLANKIEIAHFSILTPYPGTRVFKRFKEQGRLLTEDWNYYDGGRVVYRPKNFTTDQLQEGYYRTLQACYGPSGIFKRLWGTSSFWRFFLPMNMAFQGGVNKLASNWRKGAMRLPESSLS